MNNTIVDAKGLVCPKPLIKTKKALNTIGQNETLTIIIDNEISAQNVERFLKDNGYKPKLDKKDNIFTISVHIDMKPIKQTKKVEEYCEIQGHNDKHVLCFKNKYMGFGADELGEILIKGCINTIKEVSPLPRAIIFYNSAIEWVCKDSPLLDPLKELESSGVAIYVCGTCVDYYNRKDDIGVGTISNLYSILEVLTQTNKVIYP